VNDKSPLVRQWQLLAALSSRPAGGALAEFAREFDAGERTIRRDLIALCQAGFPLEESLGDHGRKHWALKPLDSLPALSLNWMEAMSLYLGRRFMKPLAGSNFDISASRAFRKIRSTLGEQPLRYLDKMSRAFHVTGAGQVDYAGKANLIDELTTAIEDRRVVQLVYQSERSTEPVSRDVHPLGWIYHGSSAYLAAYAPDHGERRLYKLDRMESAFASELRFPKPPDFSPEQFLAGALGVYRGSDGEPTVVRVRFHAAVARAVQEKRWHASQALTPQPDGSLIAEFHLTSFVEIKSWLLSWGRHAQVLEPAPLIAALRTEIAALGEMYSLEPRLQAAVEPAGPFAGHATPGQPADQKQPKPRKLATHKSKSRPRPK
jgi:proteasome accessory factor B